MSTALMPRPPFVDPDHYEVVDGVRVELPPMAARETSIASRLLRVLGTYTASQRLGEVVVEMLYQIDAARNLQRRPDVSFVSASTWPLDTEAPTDAAWAIVPDIAIEIVSPTSAWNEIETRVRDYFRGGTRQVWVVSPRHQLVYVFETQTRVRIFSRDDTLTGDPVVPGFALPLAELFLAPPAP